MKPHRASSAPRTPVPAIKPTESTYEPDLRIPPAHFAVTKEITAAITDEEPDDVAVLPKPGLGHMHPLPLSSNSSTNSESSELRSLAARLTRPAHSSPLCRFRLVHCRLGACRLRQRNPTGNALNRSILFGCTGRLAHQGNGKDGKAQH